MFPIGRISLVGVLFLNLFICVLVGQDRHEKYALLEGVTKYDEANMNLNPLSFPEDDASAFRVLLEASGYKVDLLVGQLAVRI